jgi:hypothetical protein
MIFTGRPAWPAERTLFSSCLLDAALISKRDGGKAIETPFLNVGYQLDDSWQPPAELKAPRAKR